MAAKIHFCVDISRSVFLSDIYLLANFVMYWLTIASSSIVSLLLPPDFKCFCFPTLLQLLCFFLTLILMFAMLHMPRPQSDVLSNVGAQILVATCIGTPLISLLFTLLVAPDSFYQRPFALPT